MGPTVVPKIRYEITTTGCVITHNSAALSYFTAKVWYHTRYSCQILIKLGFSQQIFRKNTQISNFIKIRPVGVELFLAYSRTDGQTWGSQQSPFLNSRKCLKKKWQQYQKRVTHIPVLKILWASSPVSSNTSWRLKEGKRPADHNLRRSTEVTTIKLPGIKVTHRHYYVNCKLRKQQQNSTSCQGPSLPTILQHCKTPIHTEGAIDSGASLARHSNLHKWSGVTVKFLGTKYHVH